MRRLLRLTIQPLPLYKITSMHAISKAVGISTKSGPVSIPSSAFLLILSARLAICSAVLNLGGNCNCSSSCTLSFLTSLRILVSRMSQIACQDCERDFWFNKDEDKAGSFISFSIKLTRNHVHDGWRTSCGG
jgi:hypothetical protein